MAGGRPPVTGVTRDGHVNVRFAPAELQHLDNVRGAQDRSTFIRQLVRDRGTS